MELVSVRERDGVSAERVVTAVSCGGPPTASLLVVIPTCVVVSPDLVIAGLPLLRRIVLAAERAGIGQVLVLNHGSLQTGEPLEGTSAHVLAPNEPLPPLLPSRVVVLPMNVIPQPKWLRALLAMPIEPARVYVEPSTVAVVDTDDPRAILSRGPRDLAGPDLVTALAKSYPAAPGTFDQRGRFVLAGSQDQRRAEDWLLRGLIKDTEGFMSRYVERRISLAISRRLAATRITPNAMTLVSLGVGLLSAPFFLSSSPAYQLTGALLFLAHSILDGCDGELARLKFMESRWGGLLDFWGDNVVHSAVFLCLAVGWSAASHTLWPVALGGSAVAGTVLSAGLVYWHTMRAPAKDGPLFTSVSKGGGSWLSRMADALARRDFIYLVVVLSAVGKAAWFLVLAAVGAPIFFLVLLWVAATESRGEGRL